MDNFKTKLFLNGGSYCLIVPKELIKFGSINPDNPVSVSIENMPEALNNEQ